jgi:hypothetical protein
VRLVLPSQTEGLQDFPYHFHRLSIRSPHLYRLSSPSYPSLSLPVAFPPFFLFFLSCLSRRSSSLLLLYSSLQCLKRPAQRSKSFLPFFSTPARERFRVPSPLPLPLFTRSMSSLAFSLYRRPSDQCVFAYKLLGRSKPGPALVLVHGCALPFLPSETLLTLFLAA